MTEEDDLPDVETVNGSFYHAYKKQLEDFALNIQRAGSNALEFTPFHLSDKFELETGIHKMQRELKVRIWDEALPIVSSPGETYLVRERGLDLVDDAHEVVRWHPACPFAGSRTGAMVALVRNIITDEPQAVHRTAVAPDGRKAVVAGKDRLALGGLAGGAVKLTADPDVTTCLGIGEGIESTLSLRRLPEFGASPVWSALNAAGIAAFGPLAGIECLWIAVDRDPAGERSAQACAERWRAAGNPRQIRGGSGWSQHAYGNAIDINPSTNPFQTHTTDMDVPKVRELAKKYGLIWGLDWNRGDPMHFEWNGTRPWLEEQAKRAVQAAKADPSRVLNPPKPIKLPDFMHGPGGFDVMSLTKPAAPLGAGNVSNSSTANTLHQTNNYNTKIEGSNEPEVHARLFKSTGTQMSQLHLENAQRAFG